MARLVKVLNVAEKPSVAKGISDLLTRGQAQWVGCSHTHLCFIWSEFYIASFGQHLIVGPE